MPTRSERQVGSHRVAILDAAIIAGPGTPAFDRYLAAWELHAGEPLSDEQIHLGLAWSDLQIPMQYLPWALENRPRAEVENGLP